MPGVSRRLRRENGVRRSAWAAVVVVACGPLAVAAEPEAAAKPLVMRPDNTVIVEQGDAYSAAYLQHYLLKCVAKHRQAADYHLDAKVTPEQRAASPGFPVVKVPLGKLPQDKNVILAAPVKSLPAGLITDAERAKLEKAKRNSILVKRVGNVVVLTKRDPDQLNLAPMRVFLDRGAGIRMYGPPGANGVEWISMPEGDSFEVGDLNVFMEPYFAKGTFSTGRYQRTREWQMMNTIVTEGANLRANHTVINFFPPDTYYDTLPQLYPMAADGTRPKPTGVFWNPCLADPELAAKTAMVKLREMMSPTNKAKPLYVEIGVQDCRYSCTCPVCKKSMEENGGDAANVWYPFINRVAKQCQEEFPGLYITTYVYSNVRKPPTGIRIEPNVCVDIVVKSYNYVNEPLTGRFAQEALDWSAVGARWVTHDWNFSGVTPRVYGRQLAAMLQWGVHHGMLGIYTEWSGGQHVGNLDGANYWVLYQLLSDPYQDTDFLWRRYCQDMFGAGWEPMYRFHDMFAQKHVVSDAFYERNDWPKQEACGFSADDVAQQRKWLEEAIAATKDDAAVQRRLATVDRCFRAHELLVKAVSVPGRLYHRHVVLGKRTDIDDEALAFYVNDDASGLLAFDEYYDAKLTLPPDDDGEDKHSGVRFAYRNNYSRALGAIIQAVRREAIEGVDPRTATRETARTVTDKAVAIYRRHLPEKRDPQRTAEIEKLMTKMLFVPRVEGMPTVDGDLADAQWSKAAVLDGFTIADILVPSREGNETKGKIMRVGDHLVIGLECRQEKGIWAETPADRFTGSAIWRESSCEFFLEPPGPPESRVGYAQYVANTLGSFRGFARAVDNRAGVQCAVKQAADGTSYTMEVALPLAVEGKYDFTQERLLEFNIQRSPFHAKTINPRERIGWAPIFFTATRPDSRGLLILE